RLQTRPRSKQCHPLGRVRHRSRHPRKPGVACCSSVSFQLACVARLPSIAMAVNTPDAMTISTAQPPEYGSFGACFLHSSRLGSVMSAPVMSYPRRSRSEEHTSELQSRENLVC